MPGLELQAASIGPSGEALAIWRSPDVLLGARYAPRRSIVLRSDADLPDLRFIQPTVEGRFIVVEGWSGSGANAWVLGAEGEVLHGANIGGHADQVCATASGEVWVGYGDQGVFDDGPAADLSSCGLVRFSPWLQPLWRFPNGAGSAVIDDCEGINVSGATVWMCPYLEFPVARIRDGAVTTWANSHFQTNIGAVLVDEPTGWVALVATGSAHKAGLTAIGSLSQTAFEPHGRVVIRLPDGAPLPPDAQLVAQGSELHVLSGHDWYRIDLAQLS